MSQAVHTELRVAAGEDTTGQLKATRVKTLPELVWAQFFGSDLESGYTFLYTWLANQFGHFMIGFAGGLAFVWIFSIWHPSALHPQTPEEVLLVTKILFIWLSLWILKEYLFDVTSGHERLRETKERLRTLREENGLAADGGDDIEDSFVWDLWRDSFMDGWFYLAGVITAFVALTGQIFTAHWETVSWLPVSWWPVISWGGDCTKSGTLCLGGLLPFLTFLILLIISGRISATWLRRNIAFDRAQLPFVRRFALTDRPIESSARQEAIHFALNRSENPNKIAEAADRGPQTKPNHLLIIGPPKSGRTGTAVALGVEALLDGARPPANIVRHITLCKMLDRLVAKERGDSETEEDELVFPPADSELLIIDDVGAETPPLTKDVNLDTPSSQPLLRAAEFRDVVERVLESREGLKQIVAGKRIIWVVGDRPDHQSDWTSALECAFGPGCCVNPAIVLRGPIEKPDRASQHANEATYGFGPTFYSYVVWKVIFGAAVLILLWYLWNDVQTSMLV